MRGVKGYVPLLLCCATALGACARRGRPAASLLPDTLQLREGDVVFRRCTGLISRAVVSQDRDGHFSHTGIVVDSAGLPMIVHAVPDEPDFPGDPDRVKMDSPDRFFSSAHAVAAAVLRPRDARAGRNAARYAYKRYRQGTLFDHDFNDTDTTRLYCTQLVTLAYRQAGMELTDTSQPRTTLPLTSLRCTLPSQVYNSPFLQPIFMFNP